MRVLILGAAGNSGLALTRAALARDHQVTAFVRDETKLASALGSPDAPAGLTVVRGDLSDTAALEPAIAGQNVVVNAAGNATVDANFTALVHAVIAATERVLGPGGRLWLYGGAAALNVPGMQLRAADLPLIPKQFALHLKNLARVEATSLDWSMLCPGPMVSASDGQACQGLRISADTWPVEGPGKVRFFKTLQIMKAFKRRMPEMVISYEDAAQVVLDHLEANGRFSRKRVGIALPHGQQGSKPGFVADAR